MGTETKSNSYTGQISTSGGNPKVMKDSLSLVCQTVKQQSISLSQSQSQSNSISITNSNSNPNQINLNSNFNSNSNTNSISNSNSNSNTNSKITIRSTTKQQEENTTITSTTTTTTTTETETETTRTTTTTKKDSIVPFVPIFVEEADVIQGAKDLLKVIRPNWDLNHVDFKKFTDGITNKLVGCFHNDSKLANDNDESYLSINNVQKKGMLAVQSEDPVILPDEYTETTDTATEKRNVNDTETNTDTEHLSVQYSDNVVLVRVYGNKTDLLIDRKAETQNFQLLHTYGLAPSLYATFKNGLVYEYVPGSTLNIESVLSPDIWPLVARRMAQMHRVVRKRKNNDDNDDNDKPLPMIWTKTQSFFDLVPERFSDADKHKRVKGTFLPIERLREEFNKLYKYLEALESPIVFSHNDLLLGNVVYTKSMNTVNFIDYEYADYNFQAFDIGNHFAEMCGVDEVDYTRYPKREFQLKWLHVYLEHYLQRQNVSNEEVEQLYVQVNQFALASHIFWTVWSLLQAEHSTIDFDYVGYAFLRYNEYLARKDEFLSLTATKKNNK